MEGTDGRYSYGRMLHHRMTKTLHSMCPDAHTSLLSCFAASGFASLDGNPCCTTNCLLQLAKPFANPDFVYATRSRTRTRGIPLMLQIHRGGMIFLSSWRSERDTVMRPLLLLPSLPQPGSTRRISITPACSGAPNSHQLRHTSTRFSHILTTLVHSGTGSRSSDADFQTASRHTYAYTNTKH